MAHKVGAAKHEYDHLMKRRRRDHYGGHCAMCEYKRIMQRLVHNRERQLVKQMLDYNDEPNFRLVQRRVYG